MKLPMTILAAAALGATVAHAETHKIVMQVDANDPAKFNLALNNVENVIDYYKAHGNPEVKIDVVAYGPGLNMYVKAKTPVATRIAAISLANPNVEFSACAVTLGKMEQKVGHKVALIEEATVVPGGVIKITQDEENGYMFLKP